MTIYLLLTATLCYGHSSENAQFMENNKRLFAHLFQDYYNTASPYNSGSTGATTEEPEELHLALSYAHLTHVVEVQMTHHHAIGIHARWRDPRLTWNAEDFGGVNYIYVHIGQLWVPEVTACESSNFGLAADRYQMVKVNSTGHAEAQFIGHASFICQFDMYAFPFDSHWCYYCFAMMSYSPDELVIRGDNAPRQIFQDTTEWSMTMDGYRYAVDLTGTRAEDRSVIFFEFLLQRRSTFWISLVIIPAFLIGFLILLGLFFATEMNSMITSVNLGLISFTSLTFIIGILAHSVPKSKSLPVLGMYILIEVLIITVAVLSVFYQKQVCVMTKKGVDWYTKEEHTTANAENTKKAPFLHRAAVFCNERVVAKGLAHFGIFLCLHISNISWLLWFALTVQPARPWAKIIQEVVND